MAKVYKFNFSEVLADEEKIKYQGKEFTKREFEREVLMSLYQIAIIVEQRKKQSSFYEKMWEIYDSIDEIKNLTNEDDSLFHVSNEQLGYLRDAHADCNLLILFLEKAPEIMRQIQNPEVMDNK